MSRFAALAATLCCLLTPAIAGAQPERLGHRTVAELRTGNNTRAVARRLHRAGARILHVSPRYATVTAALTRAQRRRVAGITGVRSVDAVVRPDVEGPRLAQARAKRAPSCSDRTISDGDTQLRAALARSAYGVDGTGVKVGVVSDSFAMASAPATTPAQDVASGDLPGAGNPCGHTSPVTVVQEPPYQSADEGRADLQIIHDMAPGAQLLFATGGISQSSMADNIIALKDAGAKVIMDDVSYPDDLFFQDGPIANAIHTVTAAGVAYIASSGNNNQRIGGQDAGSWEAPAFRPTACPTVITTQPDFPSGGDCMDFDPGSGTDNTFGIPLGANRSMNLTYEYGQPVGGVTDDFGLYLIRTVGATPSYFDANVDNVSAQSPVETLLVPSNSAVTTNDLVIVRKPGSGTPRQKFVLRSNGSTVAGFEYSNSLGGDVVGPTIFGHAGSADAQTVGAIAYNASNAPEASSSRGPVTHLFGPVGPSGGAAALATPETIAKPDLVASDGVLNTFLGGSPAPYRYYGASAGAAGVAGVAALQLQASPGLSPAQLRANQRATATPVGDFGPLAVGAGLLDAEGAIDIERIPLTIGIVGPPAGGSDPKPATTFSANRTVTFVCAVDGGAAAACASPFVPAAPLAAGNHTVVVTGTDRAGHTASGQAAFTVVGPAATITPTPTPTVTPSAKCVVPKLKGKTKARAKKALKKARCRLGKVKGKGVVKKQSPKAGARVAAGTKVKLTLAKKKKRKKH